MCKNKEKKMKEVMNDRSTEMYLNVMYKEQ